MVRITLDIDVPENCENCPLQVEPCGACIIDLPEQRSTYPYCNSRSGWRYVDWNKYNRFLDKPAWCPLDKALEEAKERENH